MKTGHYTGCLTKGALYVEHWKAVAAAKHFLILY